MISVFVLQKNILVLAFLLSVHFSIAHSKATISLLNSKEDNQSKADIAYGNAYAATFNYDYNRFCPKVSLTFKKMNVAAIENNGALETGKFLSVENTEELESKKERRICSFHDSNIKLSASIVSNHPWNFIDKSEQCHSDSLKFSEYDDVPCEMNGELNVSRSLIITPTNIMLSLSEATDFFANKSQFLVFVFKIQKGLRCSLKVQQHKIDLNSTDGLCEETENSTSCGMYNCSREISIVNQLREMIGENASITDRTPFSQFWKTNHRDKMQKKTSISDYFFEILLLVFILILILICCCTNCLGLNKVLSPSVTQPSYSRRGSASAPTNEVRTASVIPFTTTTQQMQNCNINKSKCFKKRACACAGDRMEGSSAKTKWGMRGGEESYAPVRPDNSSKYVPTVIRG